MKSSQLSSVTKSLWVATFVLSFVGCSNPQVERVPFNQLPNIDEFVEKLGNNSCLFLKAQSPRQVRVCVFGELKHKQRLSDLLPFVSNAAGLPNASVVNDRIPKPIRDATKLERAFTPKDTYWLMDVESRDSSKSISIYAAESVESGRFYFEYGWPL